MTQHNLQAVRAAAKRCNDCKFRDVFSDSQLMADYILSTIEPDGEQPVTSEWLREVWGWGERESVMCYGRFRMNASANGNGTWMLSWDHSCDNGNVWPRSLRTRQQFADLARCLGMTRGIRYKNA